MAGVAISGRALVLEEDASEWWMYGVRPSAIAEFGQTPQETALRFRERYKRVLYDFAIDAADFNEFKREVQRFFDENESAIEQQWSDAFKLIREGVVNPEEPFSRLPRKRPEVNAPEITIIAIDPSAVSPSYNLPEGFEDHPELLAA